MNRHSQIGGVCFFRRGDSRRGACGTIGLAGDRSDQRFHRIVARRKTALAQDLQSKTGLTVQAAPLDDATLRQILPEAQVLVHCTPMGMSPNVQGTSVPGLLLHAGLTVMDIVYNPRETRLLREAKAAGCRTIPGLEMFLHQAAAQFELWTNQAAPTDVMRSVLESRFS